MYRNQALASIEALGIIFPDAVDFARADGDPSKPLMALDAAMTAMDAIVGTQPGLITTANAGIPAFLSTYLDPKLVEVLVSPNKAAEILGEVRKGDWLTETATFPMVESTGEVSSYGDFNKNGRAGANVQFENRQSYLYQVFTEWGERELEKMGLAKVDWAARANIASAITLNKYQNLTYFFGVTGLQNYGLLNDPSLSPALTPVTKVAGGTGWQKATPNEIVADVQSMYAQLVAQTNGLVSLDDNLTLALHPTTEVWLVNTNSFGLSAMGILKTIFKNLRLISATQYLSGTTYSAQLIAKEIEGQEVGFSSFNEKMRAHRIIPDDSSWRQKKTQGTWGTIITFPAGIVQMAGL